MEKRWLFALVQHPMILVVNEDRGIPEVGERVPEWGAPDLETYAQRVWRNLEALRKYPDLKLNYEFSAVELKILAEHSPAIITVMREMVKNGRLAFVGGDYSQAHGQLFSGELNFRQLEKGLEVMEKLIGYKITNNFHQETCVHDQMPQLLRAFGFLTSSPPVMTHTLEPLAFSKYPRFVFSDNIGYQVLASDSVALWRGLDGTEIPIVITGVSIGGFKTDRILAEVQKGLYRSSGLIITAPDMEEIDEERYRFIRSMGESVLLDDAILNEVNTQKPNWKVKLCTYWSYSEGQWAEAVYRKVRETESMLLAEETQTAVLGAKKRECFDSDWEIVLTAMHHDVNWVEVTDLKAKYIAKMDEVLERSKRHLAALLDGDVDICFNRPVRVVNTLFFKRKEIVRFTIRGLNSVKVCDADGVEIPALCIPSWEDWDCTDVLFTAGVPALSMKEYMIAEDNKDLPVGEECSRVTVKAGESIYTIENNGIVSEASIGGRNILAGPGHDLRYPDGEGNVVGGVSRPGTMFHYKGINIDVLRITAPVGEIPVEIEYVASPENKSLIISTRFHFNSNEIGIMWNDWTKLNSYWPVAGKIIRHDIPYGVSDGSETVPLYAPNWISVKGEFGGLAVMNKGTPKHFVENGIIGCVWAWGGRTFSNRMHLGWLKNNKYDLSLKGVQTIVTGIMALNPEQSEADIAQAAQCLNTPMFTFEMKKHAESTPQKHFPDLSETGLIATAILTKDGQTECRYYEAEGKSHNVEKLSKDIGFNIHVTDLTGNAVDEITPYRIGYIYFPC
jgi:hypothetical protein